MPNLYRQVLRGVLLPSIATGVLVAVAAGAGAVAFASSRPTGFQAEVRLVVLPGAGLDPATTTAYYETLSRGQIVGTFAEVLQLERFAAAAADGLGLSPAERGEIDLRAVVIPESAMISLTVSGDSAPVAESVADAVVGEASEYVQDLAQGYELEVVSPAAGTATPTGLSGLQYAVVMTSAALVIGIAAQQVVQQVLQALDRQAELSIGRKQDQPAPPVVPRRPRVPG